MSSPVVSDAPATTDDAGRLQPMRAKLGVAAAKPHPGVWHELAPEVQSAFKVDPAITPQVLTFNNWSPNPWVVVGLNGKNLVTFSAVSLTVIKAASLTGVLEIYSVLSLHVLSDGWSVAPRSDPQAFARMHIEFLDAKGGLLATGTPYVGIGCGTNGQQQLTYDFGNDIFDLIGGAHLSLPNTTFWPC